MQHRQHVELARLRGVSAGGVEGGLIKAALIKRRVVHKVEPAMHRKTAHRACAADLPLAAVRVGLLHARVAGGVAVALLTAVVRVAKAFEIGHVGGAARRGFHRDQCALVRPRPRQRRGLVRSQAARVSPVKQRIALFLRGKFLGTLLSSNL